MGKDTHLNSPVSVVIPARNEAEHLPSLVQGIKTSSGAHELEIIVVDSASSDDTLRVAHKLGVKAVSVKKSGKGVAMQAGVESAAGSIVVFIDGDGSYSPGALSQMIERIMADKADIVYGSRFLHDSVRDMSAMRFCGNTFFQALARLRYGVSIDFLTGFFVVKKSVLTDLQLSSLGYEIETEIFVKAIKKNLRINEVPITYVKNTTSKLKPLTDGLKILRTLLKTTAA